MISYLQPAALYAVSDTSTFYIINTTSEARLVNATAFFPRISGEFACIDFHPTVDRVRLVTNTGQNIRLHPERGAIAATYTPIYGAGTPSSSGIVYTNSISGTTSTT